jgi:hypothetical protein
MVSKDVLYRIFTFMIYFSIKYNLPNSRTLSVTSAVKPQARYRFHAAVILLFYVIQTKCYNKSCIFFEDWVCHRILLSCVSMLLMMLVLVPPQMLAFLCCGVIDGRELYGRVKCIMSQHFSVLCVYALNESVPPQKFTSLCCCMIDKELLGRVKVVTSQHFSVLCTCY